MTTITTGRLVLRPLVSSDAEALVSGLDNLAVSRWTSRIPFPYTLADAREFIAICATGKTEDLRLALVLDGAIIGVISYEGGSSTAPAEIGYWIAQPHWGKGLGREAARAIVDHGFEAGGLVSLTARHDLGNAASRRILEGLGFVRTGDEQGFSRARNAATTVARLHLSKDDWASAKARRG